LGGGGEVVTNLLGGHVDVGFVCIPPVKSHYLSGKAHILAVLSPKRLPAFRDVPPIVEKGYQNSTITTGVGLIGPKGLTPAIAKKWKRTLEMTIKDPNAAIEKFDYMVDFKQGEDFRKEILAEFTEFKKIFPTPPSRK
jgi:tripartite-type tricarboxylate transporter receptor subunit TctC